MHFVSSAYSMSNGRVASVGGLAGRRHWTSRCDASNCRPTLIIPGWGSRLAVYRWLSRMTDC